MKTDINKLVLVHMNISVDTQQNKAERLKQTSWWNHSQQGLFTGTIHMKGEVRVLQINSDWYMYIINTGRVGKLEFNSIRIEVIPYNYVYSFYFNKSIDFTSGG